MVLWAWNRADERLLMFGKIIYMERVLSGCLNLWTPGYAQGGRLVFLRSVIFLLFSKERWVAV